MSKASRKIGQAARREFRKRYDVLKATVKPCPRFIPLVVWAWLAERFIRVGDKEE